MGKIVNPSKSRVPSMRLVGHTVSLEPGEAKEMESLTERDIKVIRASGLILEGEFTIIAKKGDVYKKVGTFKVEEPVVEAPPADEGGEETPPPAETLPPAEEGGEDTPPPADEGGEGGEGEEGGEEGGEENPPILPEIPQTLSELMKHNREELEELALAYNVSIEGNKEEISTLLLAVGKE